ncbi:MAG: D-tyrosyl-tRNA(Tyr) deacylase [Chlamydiia bacterium]|nr:D-tyrosyl-tRNA(Tyr) deacylase [Chlamydiia bacterium]
MKRLIQRVSEASVVVDAETVGKIGRGLLVFLGIHQDDTEAPIPWLVQKLIHLRIFCDDEGKMNRSVEDIGGEILVVSQFTLYGTCSKGRRPEFTQAAQGDAAQDLYEAFIACVRRDFGSVETGRFAAKMAVSLVNDGPVTLIMEKF